MSQTLANVLTDMVMVRGGTDRAALVRPGQMGKEPAVCVIMTSKKALRQLGKPILNVARKLGDAPSEFGCPGFNEKVGLTELFAAVDRTPNGWCWATFKFFKLDVTLAIFCRSVDEVAKVCNEHGTPCSLDSKRPAEGYEIEKVLERQS